MRISLPDELIRVICYWGNNRANPAAAVRNLQRRRDREGAVVQETLVDYFDGIAKLRVEIQLLPYVLEYALEAVTVDETGMYIETYDDQTFVSFIEFYADRRIHPRFEYKVSFRPLFVTYKGKKFAMRPGGYEIRMFENPFPLPDFIFGDVPKTPPSFDKEEVHITIKKGGINLASETIHGIDRDQLHYYAHMMKHKIEAGEFQEVRRWS